MHTRLAGRTREVDNRRADFGRLVLTPSEREPVLLHFRVGIICLAFLEAFADGWVDQLHCPSSIGTKGDACAYLGECMGGYLSSH